MWPLTGLVGGSRAWAGLLTWRWTWPLTRLVGGSRTWAGLLTRNRTRSLTGLLARHRTWRRARPGLLTRCRTRSLASLLTGRVGAVLHGTLHRPLGRVLRRILGRPGPGAGLLGREVRPAAPAGLLAGEVLRWRLLTHRWPRARTRLLTRTVSCGRLLPRVHAGARWLRVRQGTPAGGRR
ncbi:hypothetical protein ACIA8G_24220 [Lentzea sp. NPDC051213]|uniref:hypothetical protein n=1 Tax=Lentzea sp. NPDC051213 TaxID=3364126 RepID=UPI00379B908E